MQPLPASPEIAEGPHLAWTEAIGGAAHPLLQAASETLIDPTCPTPRTLQARGVRFSRPARRAGIPGTDAR